MTTVSKHGQMEKNRGGDNILRISNSDDNDNQNDPPDTTNDDLDSSLESQK